MSMTRFARRAIAAQGLALLLAAVWVPYFVLHCTRCPQQLVGWQHCAEMANTASRAPSHSPGVQHAGHAQHGNPSGDRAEAPASKGTESCCGADQLRAAATDSVSGAAGTPTMAVTTALAISVCADPRSEASVRRLRANSHGPPRYLTLNTFLL